MIIRYRVKKEFVEEAKKRIRGFVTKVKDNEPEILVYESFQSEKDPQEFVHHVKFQTEEAEKFHRRTDYYREFVEILYPLCEREPEFEKLVGFY